MAIILMTTSDDGDQLVLYSWALTTLLLHCDCNSATKERDSILENFNLFNVSNFLCELESDLQMEQFDEILEEEEMGRDSSLFISLSLQ